MESDTFTEGRPMTTTFRAVYVGGVLRPIDPLALAEGQMVEGTFTPTEPLIPAASEEEIVRRIKESKTYHEWLEVTRLLPADDAGYDIVKALDDNRRWSDER